MFGRYLFLSICFFSSTFIHAQDIAILKKKHNSSAGILPQQPHYHSFPFYNQTSLKYIINSFCVGTHTYGSIHSNGVCAHAAPKWMLSRPPVESIDNH